MLETIKIVLVETSHPGNIGATARAMKNMGLTELVLVNPKDFPSLEATRRAAGADEILTNAKVCSHLDAAIADCQWIAGCSARLRKLPQPLLAPRVAAHKIHQQGQMGSVALLFGRESRGLSNAELQRCHAHIHIPTAPHFSSLNLAAAVQILCYELRLAALVTPSQQDKGEISATHEQITRFYKRFEELLWTIQFLKPANPKMPFVRLKRLFNRACITEHELAILWGVVETLIKRLDHERKKNSQASHKNRN